MRNRKTTFSSAFFTLIIILMLSSRPVYSFLRLRAALFYKNRVISSLTNKHHWLNQRIGPYKQQSFLTKCFFSSTSSSSNLENNTVLSEEAKQLQLKIREQADLVRTLKAQQTPKSDLLPAIEELKRLKALFEDISGHSLTQQTSTNTSKTLISNNNTNRKSNNNQNNNNNNNSNNEKLYKITPRHVDYSAWYADIIAQSDLVDASPVRGCMVIKPWGMGVWDILKQELDTRIRATGTQNAYFPLFIPQSFLVKEAEHVDGFAKECAVVTHHRLCVSPDNSKQLIPDPEAKLEEPLIVRPTSETIIWNLFGKWINSHRDLPLQVNQWANVVRWEMRTRPFLRTTEFLWQEGHTAHATKDEADALAKHMLQVYAELCENVLALPTVQGEKSPSERFAGADATYTIEAQMQNGWALQSGTSHFLGQNFAKAFDVKYQISENDTSSTNNDNGNKIQHNNTNKLEYVWATSWGVSTRLLGALLMTHSDDVGVILPPRIAPIHIIVLPIVSPNDPENKQKILQRVQEVVHVLRSSFMSVDHTPPSSSKSKPNSPDLSSSGPVWDTVTERLFASIPAVPYTPPTSPFTYTSSSIFATPLSSTTSNTTSTSAVHYSLRVHIDDRDHVRPGMKFYEWEEKGVPLRLEIGAKDLANDLVTVAIRHNKTKHTIPYSSTKKTQFAEEIIQLLLRIQEEMYHKAQSRVQAHTYAVTTYAEMIKLAEKEGKSGWYLVPWHCDRENEGKIKEDSKMTIRCYPWVINQAMQSSGELEKMTCFYSGRPATHVALFGRAF